MRGKEKRIINTIGSKATNALNATEGLSQRLNRVEGIAYASACILAATGLVGAIITLFLDPIRTRPSEWDYLQISGILLFSGLFVVGVYLVSYMRQR